VVYDARNAQDFKSKFGSTSHWCWSYCYTVTWPITEANMKHLEGLHHNCLRRILNITK